MKITLYMAISIDGLVAKKDGDSDWVSEVDSVIFQQKMEEIGCIIVGRRTFEQFQGTLYPVKGIINIVLTKDKLRTIDDGNVIFAQSPQEVVKIAEKNGYDKALLIGGGTTNGLFAKNDLIDEIFLTVHPLVLGEGIKLFENCEADIRLELIGINQLEQGLVQLHYSIKR